MFGYMLYKSQKKKIEAQEKKIAAQEKLINAQRENIETSNALIKAQSERIAQQQAIISMYKANNSYILSRFREMKKKYGHGKETNDEQGNED